MHRKRTILIPIAIFGILGTGLHAIWFLSERGTKNALRLQNEITAEQTTIRLEEYLRFRLELVAQIRREWAQGQISNKDQFVNRAKATYEQFSGFQAINWIDSHGIIRWVVPRAPNISALNKDLHDHPGAGPFFKEAEKTGEIRLTPPIKLLQKGLGIASYFPVTVGENRLGYVNGVFRISEMIQDCLQGKVLQEYGLTISDGAQILFDNTQGHIDELAVQSKQTISLEDRTWTLKLAPAQESSHGRLGGLDKLLMGIGVLLALGLAWVSRLYLLKQTDLARSERNTRQLLESLPDLLFLINTDGIMVDHRLPENARLCRNRDEIQNRALSELLTPSQAQSALIGIEHAIKIQRTTIFEYQMEFEGEERHFEARLVPRDDQHVLAIVRDVTQEKRAAKALIVSENKYRTLFEESQDVILLTTPDGHLTDINPAGVRMFGFNHKDEISDLGFQKMTFFDSAEREALWDTLRLQGEVRNREVTLKNRHGKKIHALVSISAERKEDGEIAAMRSTIRDITTRKRLEQQLIQAQKMESMGTLAGGIAHDFNNILSGILGYASILKSKLDSSTSHYQHAETIEKSALRAAELTAQLLAFSRGGVFSIRPLDLNAIISETLQIIGRTFDKSINIVTNLSSDLATVNADESQLQQVIMNICVNSRDAMPNGGELSIMTRNEFLSPEVEESHTDAEPGSYVRMSIADSGVGIQGGIQERIFEPFFTTKGPGQGTGLGLSVVFGVVRNHNGFIEMESTDKGTTFHVFLPQRKNPLCRKSKWTCPSSEKNWS